MALKHRPSAWVSLIRKLFPSDYQELYGQVYLHAGRGKFMLPVNFRPYQVETDVVGGVGFISYPCAPPFIEVVEVEVERCGNQQWCLTFEWRLAAPKRVDWEAYGFKKNG